VAAAQIVSGPDPVAALATATEAMRRDGVAGAQLVVLPEASMACFGTDLGAVVRQSGSARWLTRPATVAHRLMPRVPVIAVCPATGGTLVGGLGAPGETPYGTVGDERGQPTRVEVSCQPVCASAGQVAGVPSCGSSCGHRGLAWMCPEPATGRDPDVPQAQWFGRMNLGRVG
jgi:hypothetical protein